MTTEAILRCQRQLEQEYGGSYSQMRRAPWFELLDYPEEALVRAVGEMRMMLQRLPDPELVVQMVKKHARILEALHG